MCSPICPVADAPSRLTAPDCLLADRADWQASAGSPVLAVSFFALALEKSCSPVLRPIFQAAEEARAVAASLEEQLAQSASELARLQQQHSGMQQSQEAASAWEADLIRRCEALETGRQAAAAEQEAAAAALRHSRAAAAEVCFRS